MKFANTAIRSANGFKTNTSKERAVLALAGGKCDGCEREITAHSDMIKWSRRFGVFHAACFGVVPLTQPAANQGADPAQVRKLIDDALKANTADVDESRLLSLIDKVLATRMPRELHVVNVDKKLKKLKHAHAMLEKLIFIISLKKHAYLWGPPGSGKSTGAMHAADALSLKYGYISLNPQTPESRLIGYNDANGKYVKTVLFDLYSKGGVYCIDEMDNASASLLTTLNSLLENGFGAFPCGMIEKHPDFVVVATGNTAGRGGNMQFPERRAFDAAFAERFSYLHWGYDEAMERDVALTFYSKGSAWVDWVQAVRKFALTADPKLVISPRATFGICQFLAQSTRSPFAINEVLDAVLFKGVEPERVNRIINNHPLPSAA